MKNRKTVKSSRVLLVIIIEFKLFKKVISFHRNDVVIISAIIAAFLEKYLQLLPWLYLRNLPKPNSNSHQGRKYSNRLHSIRQNLPHRLTLFEKKEKEKGEGKAVLVAGLSLHFNNSVFWRCSHVNVNMAIADKQRWEPLSHDWWPWGLRDAALWSLLW